MLPTISTTTSAFAHRLIRHQRLPQKCCCFQPLHRRQPLSFAPCLSVKNYFEKGKKNKKIELLNHSNRRGKMEPVGMRDTKSLKPVAKIFDGITLRQLSVAVDKTIDSLVDCIFEISNEKTAEKYLENSNAPLDRELVMNIVSMLGMRPIQVPPAKVMHLDETQLDLLPQPPPPESERRKRAPIVTIMGHVDHGKTTLLDALRRSNIVAGEFGGITQHIGAFSVKLPDVGNEPVTFLDTPGHAAFKAMRERGARATDIVVLVVAADDSVMEQTVESINYAREAGVPIIVAINKCDKPGVDPEQTLQDLLQYDIVPEQYGGDTLVVQISALYGRGIDKLQESILLQSEMMQLESTDKGPVEATIIESTTAHGLGNVCTLVVNRGTLRKGTVLVAGTSWGRVRSMTNEFNAPVQEAGPSTPVRISGWRDQLPSPGEVALEAPSEGKAQSVVEFRRSRKQEIVFVKDMELVERRREEARQKYHEKRMENFRKGILAKIGEPPPSYTTRTEEEKEAAKVPRLDIIIKCDVDGTHEAIHDVLATYDAADQVRLEIVDSGVGAVTEHDMELAAETGAHVFAFNTPISHRLQEMANEKKVKVERFNVIYKLVERLKELLTERIRPVVERRMLGEGTVLLEYRISVAGQKKQPVAGIRVESGALDRKAIWRFVRMREMEDKQEKAAESYEPGTAVIYEGPIESMQCEKQLVNRATVNMEIGVAVADKNVRYMEDDRVECYEEVNVPQRIRWKPPGF